jgi:CheY-like chemotaxis protein
MKLRQMAPLAASGKAETLLKEADHILTQSLDYTRSLVAELAPPALHDFGLTQALAWLASQMQQHGLHVRVTSQQDVLAIPEDQAMLLFQSVRELLFNVLKHAQAKQATVSVSITPNHELHLSVTDEGCGFDLNRIQQTDPKRFGLFSLRERLVAMGGRFELHSTVGQGTHALLVTPYWPAPSGVSSHNGPVANGKPSHSDRERSEEDAEHGPGHSPATPHAVPHIRVLLVDDHAMVRQGLCSVLKEYEDVVVAGEACNGAEALDQVEALHPSVVVMDINMPKMNGIQATAVIKARHPDISVIGLSVQAGGLNEEAMKQVGAVTLLTKEAAVDELYSAIQAALAGRRSLGVQ